MIAAWRFGDPEDEPVRGLNDGQTPAAPAQLPKTTGTARLELRATRGNSYLIVRSRSAVGTVVYQGTLERGQQQRFEGQGALDPPRVARERPS